MPQNSKYTRVYEAPCCHFKNVYLSKGLCSGNAEFYKTRHSTPQELKFVTIDPHHKGRKNLKRVQSKEYCFCRCCVPEQSDLYPELVLHHCESILKKSATCKTDHEQILSSMMNDLKKRGLENDDNPSYLQMKPIKSVYKSKVPEAQPQPRRTQARSADYANRMVKDSLYAKHSKEKERSKLKQNQYKLENINAEIDKVLQSQERGDQISESEECLVKTPKKIDFERQQSQVKENSKFTAPSCTIGKSRITTSDGQENLVSEVKKYIELSLKQLGISNHEFSEEEKVYKNPHGIRYCSKCQKVSTVEHEQNEDTKGTEEKQEANEEKDTSIEEGEKFENISSGNDESNKAEKSYFAAGDQDFLNQEASALDFIEQAIKRECARTSDEKQLSPRSLKDINAEKFNKEVKSGLPADYKVSNAPTEVLQVRKIQRDSVEREKELRKKRLQCLNHIWDQLKILFEIERS